jgi:hypothetical protein
VTFITACSTLAPDNEFMLSKCTNPSCSHKFRYLHQGKLFLLKSSNNEDTSSSRLNFAGRVDGIQYAWLCDKCATQYELALDREDKVKIRTRYELSGIIATIGISVGLQLLSAANIAGELCDLIA